MGACGSCGADVGGGARFCAQCGAPYQAPIAPDPTVRTEAPPAASTAARSTTLLARTVAPPAVDERAPVTEPVAPVVVAPSSAGLSSRRSRPSRRIGAPPTDQTRGDA